MSPSRTPPGTLGPLPKQKFKRGGFLQSLGTFFTTLFSGTNFSNADLTKYLAGLAKRRDIEGDIDSDNKARAVVDRWKKSTAGFSLTGLQKMLLIRELQDGATGDDDERAILDILKRSEPGDLRIIFGYIRVNDLLGDFDGAEKKELLAWIDLRFDDGVDGLRAGKAEPDSRLPTDLPLPPYDAATLLAKFDTDQYLATEIIAELARRSIADRERAARDLAVARTALQRPITAKTDVYQELPDGKAKEALEKELLPLIARLRRMDIVMQEGFKDIVLTESPSAFGGKKKTLTPDEKVKARDALRPKMDSVAGTPQSFKAKHPDEDKDYTQKLRAIAPDMIKAYWDAKAKDRQPSDRGDASKMHTLLEMEALASGEQGRDRQRLRRPLRQEPPPADEGGPPGPARQPARSVARHGQGDAWPVRLTGRRSRRRLMFYFFQSNKDVIPPLNRRHFASPRFDRHDRPLNDEAIAQDTIAKEFTTTAAQVRTLNEIDRGWDASANSGDA